MVPIYNINEAILNYTKMFTLLYPIIKWPDLNQTVGSFSVI